MKIEDLYNARVIKYSIEVFPPKNGGSLESLLLTVENLNSFRPAFVSVTFGAGGNARGGTIEIATMIKRRYGLETIAHVTAVGKSKQDIENLLVGANYSGITTVLALRGDTEQGKGFRMHESGHEYAYQLVAQIKAINEGKYLQGEGQRTNFSIGVACYPEGHKDNPRKDLEAEHLKIKQDAGADFAITQMFFDNAAYFNFVDKARAAGVTIPIIPGVMPIKDIKSVRYFKDTFGVNIAEKLTERLENCKNDKQAMKEGGMQYTIDQCRGLLAGGAPGVHIYTMNSHETAQKIADKLRSI